MWPTLRGALNKWDTTAFALLSWTMTPVGRLRGGAGDPAYRGWHCGAGLFST
jgi:hypothetical protein